MNSFKKFIRRDANERRENAKRHYLNKYYNLFLNSYSFENLDEEQTHFLLDQFWKVGKIAAFKIKMTENEMNPSGILGLVPFAPSRFNIYNYPVEVTLINTRGVPFIPSAPQNVNTDVVIGFAQRDHLSVYEHISFLVEKLVDYEMLVKASINAAKLPYLIACSPEDKKKLQDITDRILNDEEVVFTDAEDIKNIKIMNSGVPFILDKISQLKDDVENKIKEYLGIDNADFKKKEYINIDDTNSNNQLIEQNGDVFLDELKEFCERVSKILNYPISVEAKNKMTIEENPNDEGGEEDE